MLQHWGAPPGKLSRAFEGRSLTLNAALRLMRLYKSRELLRRKRHLPIARIAAMVHFRNAKHFATQFKKHFRCTPSEERKGMK
ncbi:helix-turn-helix domain-containing protein [Parapedobacter sp. 2B3]|uniref:helix-turn-helix domain-containing protein n=1 Tax=Parapedobacter sp. 2B3 TaxID=3342381 RepID=UPI0035B5F3F1